MVFTTFTVTYCSLIPIEEPNSALYHITTEILLIRDTLQLLIFCVLVEEGMVCVLLVFSFVCFVRVRFCHFSLLLGVGGWLRFVIVALPGRSINFLSYNIVQPRNPRTTVRLQILTCNRLHYPLLNT